MGLSTFDPLSFFRYCLRVNTDRLYRLNSHFSNIEKIFDKNIVSEIGC